MVTVLNRILYLCWWKPDLYNNLKDRLLYNWQCFLNICCWLLKFIPNKQITLLCFLGSGMTVFLLKTNQRGHWWSSLAALWIPLSNQEVTSGSMGDAYSQREHARTSASLCIRRPNWKNNVMGWLHSHPTLYYTIKKEYTESLNAHGRAYFSSYLPNLTWI